MRWTVDWNNGVRSTLGPRVSVYWTVHGQVVAATPALRWCVGLTHTEVFRWLRFKGYRAQPDGPECVPHTVKHHKLIKANVDALVGLLEQRHDP